MTLQTRLMVISRNIWLIQAANGSIPKPRSRAPMLARASAGERCESAASMRAATRGHLKKGKFMYAKPEANSKGSR
jgi:hypothetical protein